MRRIISFLLFVQLSQYSAAQQNVAINSTGAAPHASALLDISSTSKGLLIPRMTSSQRTAIASPAISLIVFDTDTNSFWYYNGTSWINLGASASSWLLTGNSGTNPLTNYIGTNDNVSLRFKLGSSDVGLLATNGNVFWGLSSGYNNTTGTSNTGMGINALFGNSTGYYNTAIGSNSLPQNNTGFENTAIGATALQSNTTGYTNVATGIQTLYSNTTGSNNTATGGGALAYNTTGYSNVAVGVLALYKNTTRSNLVAVGDSALFNNETGATLSNHATHNTALGSKALYANTTGYENTATGFNALRDNSTGQWNTAAGSYSLSVNTSGLSNTATGYAALRFNTIGNYNTATGWSSLFANTGGGNTATGAASLGLNSTGNSNTAAGYLSLENNTGGSSNAAFGSSTLDANTTGYSNVAVGDHALYRNTTKSNLVAVGDSALFNNGNGATLNSQAIYNTAVGSKSLYTNTTGFDNTATGSSTLFNNSTGSSNTTLGSYALWGNTTGNTNTSVGAYTLVNSNGNSNTAIGQSSMINNTGGSNNTAVGTNTLTNNSSGSNNTAIGFSATVAVGNLDNATSVGARGRVDCSNCLVLGSVNGINGATSNVNVGIGTTLPQQLLSVAGAMNIDQGNANNGALNPGISFGSASGEAIASKRTAGGNQYGLDFYTSSANRMSISNTGNVGIAITNPQATLHLGNGAVLKINDLTGTRYIQLFHSTSGNLHLDAFGGGTNYISWYGGTGLHVGNGTSGGYGPVNASAFNTISSRLYKKDITDTHYGLAQVLQLQGKEYKYIHDSTNRKEIGLIAEDVEKVVPEVVYRNLPDKQIPGIDYGKLVTVLIEAVKEQQLQIEELKKDNAEIKKILKKSKTD